MLATLFYYLSNNRKGCLDLLRLSSTIGNSLNSRCDRFLKAEIIDTAYSRIFPRLKYVDEIGYDFTFFDWKVSQKSQSYAFKSKVGRTNKITMSNTNGSDISYKIFDYIIITQTAYPFSIAVAEYNVVSRFMKKERDSITAEIPFSHLQFVIHPNEGVSFGRTSMDFKAYKNEMINRMLDMGFLEKVEQSTQVAVA